jgi:hypothetical protein
MRQQRNVIFRAINDAGFDTAEFVWETSANEASDVVGHQLRHVPTGSYFLFTADPGEWEPGGWQEMTEWSPGAAQQSVRTHRGSWEEQLDRVQGWLANIKGEFYDPDLWEEAAGALGEGADEGGFFSPDERAELSTQLREIANHMAEQRGLSGEERAALEVRFVLPLEEASGKLPRGQWKTLLVGALITEGVRIGLESHAMQELFNFTVQALGHLFGGGMPQLPIAS